MTTWKKMLLTLISNKGNTEMNFKQETVTIPKEEYEALMAKYNEVMSHDVTETIINNLTKCENEGLWFYACELEDLYDKCIDCFDGQMILVFRFNPYKFHMENGKVYDRDSMSEVTGAPTMNCDGVFFTTYVNSRSLEGYINPKTTHSEYLTICKFLKF